MRRFKGFTLTELMIAMAVIGILIAVVTPAIFKTRPNKNKMMIKKTFYATESIVSALINDETLYPDMRDICDGAEAAAENQYCAYGFDYTEDAVYEGYEYTGDDKFAALFKDRLNVKNNDATLCTGAVLGNTGPEENDFCPIFTTNDGTWWDLRGTRDAWNHKNPPNAHIGTFDQCTTADANAPGCGTITIDVDSSNGTSTECTEANEDCDTYQIQILANGKMRINPDHARAVRYATINTAIRDNAE